MHWRGGWGLFDMLVAAIIPDNDDPHRPVLIAALTVFLYSCVVALRSARNLLACPYFVYTDGKVETYQFETRFRRKEKLSVLGTNFAPVKIQISFQGIGVSHLNSR
ncbi:hypothetical protein RR46_14156 [Papilio xuthus]|uniref:Uncharacterized protein n=1 Tax=Papilio xuthus TaxID=66420 RepID=A0A194PP76_PAPXU|nr:hypothetical protein RR46_14156 [Papilio xuthus]